MEWRVLVLRFVHTWLHSCARWGKHLAKQTLTYGIRLRPGLMTTLGIMPTDYVMLTTFYVYTMILWLYSTWPMGTCHWSHLWFGDPDIYLGAKLKPTRLENGIWAWGLSPSKYVAQAVKNCEKHPTDKLNNTFQLPQRADNPYPYDYCPELDLSDPLDPECSSFYQHLIGEMRWMVKLSRIDIATEVSLLSSHLAYPCEGHLETALHMISYLHHKNNKRLIFDPAYPKNDMESFPQLIGPNSMVM